MVTVVMARRRRDGRNWSSSSRLIFPPGQQVISERWTTARHQSNKPTMSTFIDRMDGNKTDVCLPGKKQMMNPAARGCLLIYINNNRSVSLSLFYNVSISTLYRKAFKNINARSSLFSHTAAYYPMTSSCRAHRKSWAMPQNDRFH